MCALLADICSGLSRTEAVFVIMIYAHIPPPLPANGQAILGQMNRPEEYSFPFVRMSLAVTDLLLQLLHVGETRE